MLKWETFNAFPLTLAENSYEFVDVSNSADTRIHNT